MTLDVRIVDEGGGASSSLNLGAGTAVVSGSPGTCVRVSIVTVPTGASTVNDCATTGAIATSNAILTIPANTIAGTVYTLDWPCLVGICVSVGTAGVLAVAYNNKV